ncbi:sensor histidine kinase [Streptomyces sp. NPDC021212]|uniref:sensor histidine kinase n=1 Tax=Streptomyces sp. NPDC021212 TaxID=3365118 RepID=UPI0037A9108A
MTPTGLLKRPSMKAPTVGSDPSAPQLLGTTNSRRACEADVATLMQADRLGVAVSADGRLILNPPIESAVYFGVAELLTNAVRHAHASRVLVGLARDEADLVVEVEDDGRGGADERVGSGLAGQRRRLAVFDGTLEITSPPGGPTRVRMALPCESL